MKTAGEFAHLIYKLDLLNHAHLRRPFQQIWYKKPCFFKKSFWNKLGLQIAFIHQRCLSIFDLWEVVSVSQRFINIFVFLIVTLFDKQGGVKSYFLQNLQEKLFSEVYLQPSHTSMMEFFWE